LSISDEHLLLTSRITEGKRNTRTTRVFRHNLRWNQMKIKNDITSLKISAEED